MYGSLYTGFSNEKSDVTGVIVGVYIVMLFELVGTLSISCIWSKLSFRATHIAERLGLLGLIIIGEGVIGTTKTITRIMGKNGVYLEGCALIFCIVLILVRHFSSRRYEKHFLTGTRFLCGWFTLITCPNTASARSSNSSG